MNTKNNIGIYFLGLTAKETSLFERVVSFHITHGLEVALTDDMTEAGLIITATESYHLLESSNKTHVVIVDDNSNEQGDLQICRPLMITKVMACLTDAVNLCKVNQSESTEDTSSGLIDVKIEEAELVINAETVTEDSSSSIQASNETIAIPATTATEETSDNTEKASHHALIIDDSAAIRKQLELELRDAGISSDFAECGEDALEKIKTNHFDLVFLDIIMPGIDGYETCKGIRTNAAFKKTPVIMLSGKTSPLDEVQGVIAGATTYLTKPVKSDKLQETLSRVTKWLENYAPAKTDSKPKESA